MLYPIIIAGGQGTRLWPISRRDNPKQIKPFLDGKTLIYKTFERLKKNVPTENIFLSTFEGLKTEIKKELTEVLEDNIITEPKRRDTAPALGLSLLRILEKDQNAIFVYVNADNFIKDEERFWHALHTAENIIKQNSGKVLLLGIKPAYAETGYGYIEAGEEIEKINEHKICSVKKFVEKPDLKTAQNFLLAGNFLWNPTLIVAKAEHFLGLYRKHLPDIYEQLLMIKGGGDLDKIFSRISPISIDYGILEKERDMLVMEADFGWMDIGHWKAIFKILKKEENENVEIGRHLNIDSRGNLIYSNSNKLIATAGIEDMIIVDSGDAILICPKNRAQDVKKLVKKMEEAGMGEYL